MAEQKKQKQKVVRVHSSDDMTTKIRAKALNEGSASVCTEPVGPNQVVTIAVFRTKKAAASFEAWVKSLRREEVKLES